MDKYEFRRQKLIELMNSHCDGKVASLAKRLERSDSYVARMLYPVEKPGFKRIGEDMADVIAQAFQLDRRSLDTPTDAPAATPATPSVQLQWVENREAYLLSLFRGTDSEGQDSIIRLAEIMPRVVALPLAVVNGQK